MPLGICLLTHGTRRIAMEKIFADSCYWIGLFDPKDQLHAKASKAKDRYKEHQLVTTQEVLTEFLTRMKASDKDRRTKAVEFLRNINEDQKVQVLSQSHESFDQGGRLYFARPDKDYSLQDCISMNAIEQHGIHLVLTNDHHFEQEGFFVLL